MTAYIKELLELFNEAVASANKCLDMWAERLNKENFLASISSYDFVCALRPVAERLSEQTGRAYCDILNEATDKVLQGEDIAEILWHFDAQLIR